MSNITDTGALLTVNIVSTSILMCFGAKQLADLFHYDMRTKTDPYLWWIKTLCSLWATINAVGANWGSHGVNAFVEAIWLFQVWYMYQRNKLGGACLAFLFLLRLGEGIADTILGEGYIDPVLGCSFIQNPITGQLYEYTDLAIDFISTICIGIYLVRARAGNVSSASNSIYASIGITNLIRNVILTTFNVILSIILNQDPTSPLIVPLFQFQLVAMFSLTCYERDILLLFKHIYEGTSDQDRKTVLTNDTKKLGTVSKGHSSIAKENSFAVSMQKESSAATRNETPNVFQKENSNAQPMFKK
ncbi:hypothetical protein HK103_006581 [Boothiomyces macroporosus]|uniref:Uncharacterized protein n=1 Tax=Boothiomyces macroporosus TaxID=261099 RepID=A0AAD5UDP2_9FUNG|nr:hypothetical protein HK103_006581 [Boothiomyces macroporosus]